LITNVNIFNIKIKYNKYEKLLSDFDIPDMKKEKFLKSFEKDVYENLL